MRAFQPGVVRTFVLQTRDAKPFLFIMPVVFKGALVSSAYLQWAELAKDCGHGGLVQHFDDVQEAEQYHQVIRLLVSSQPQTANADIQ